MYSAYSPFFPFNSILLAKIRVFLHKIISLHRFSIFQNKKKPRGIAPGYDGLHLLKDHSACLVDIAHEL